MLTINFNPFHNLETKRLLLRKLSNSDVKEVFAIRSNANVMQYIPRPPLQNEAEALEHITMINDKIEKNEGINWAITLKGNPKLIGIIGHFRIQPQNYRSEIGYIISPEYHGQGIVTEAIEEIVRYGFEELKLHSIEAIIDPRNLASERALQKNGFTKEAHILENEFFDGQFIDTVIYSLLKRNFKN